MPINIAIDGPAGAGKSTVAKKLAEDYGITADRKSIMRGGRLWIYLCRYGGDVPGDGVVFSAPGHRQP